jgi:predicted PurR-regulated permease PerM
LLSLLVISALGALFLLLPFWPWLVLALWTASLARPLLERLTRAIHGKRGAAGVLTLGLLVVALTPLVAGIVTVAPDVYELTQRALSSGSGRGALVQLVSTSSDANGAPTQHLEWGKLMQLVRTHGAEAWTLASGLAATMGSVGLGILVFFTATYACMVHGREAYLWLQRQIPLAPTRIDRVRDAFQETGRGLLYSVAITGFLQATLATIAYAALGVPRALALGLATFLTSLIPAIGPFLVWGPVAVGLWLSGQGTKAAILALVCAIIVAPADNVLRPLLARRGKLELHPWLVLFAMLGGVVTVGGWGIMLGPLVFRLAFEFAYLMREARSEQLHA